MCLLAPNPIYTIPLLKGVPFLFAGVGAVVGSIEGYFREGPWKARWGGDGRKGSHYQTLYQTLDWKRGHSKEQHYQTHTRAQRA